MLNLALLSSNSGGEAALAGVGIVGFLFYAAIIILAIASEWKLFSKAGEPGWAALIPFYNTYVLFKIAIGDGIKFLFLFIPIVDIYFSIKVLVSLSKAFGKSGAYALGLIFLPFIFLPLLAFGNNSYSGPVA